MLDRWPRERVELLGNLERPALDEGARDLVHCLTVVTGDGAFLDDQKGGGHEHDSQSTRRRSAFKDAVAEF